jgi:hypothetical protein
MSNSGRCSGKRIAGISSGAGRWRELRTYDPTMASQHSFSPADDGRKDRLFPLVPIAYYGD